MASNIIKYSIIFYVALFFSIYTYPVPAQQYGYYIMPLGEFSPRDRDFKNLIFTLQHAEKGDKVAIDVDSPGGEVVMLYYLESVIKASKAEVVCVADKTVASAAAMFIADFCVHHYDTRISKVSSFLFHYPFFMDDAGNVQPIVGPERAAYRIWFEKHLSYLLTKQELDGMYLDNKEVVLTGEEVIRRLGDSYNDVY